MLWTILIILLILMLVGAVPRWGYNSGWGYGPSGLVGLDREGHDHAREHHTRGQGQEREDLRVELCHLGSPPKRRCVGVNALPRHGIPRV